MPLFDAVLVVDWSASSVPKEGKDSIWIGLAVRGRHGTAVEALENPPTRAAAEARARELLRELVARERRVLAGFDLPYGYPSGFAAALGAADAAPWRATWARLSSAIRDDERNRNNRFEVAADWNEKLGSAPGPFWGCPPSRRSAALRSSGCAFPYPTTAGTLERRRLAERRLPRAQETWKLYGIGSVGSQSLVGIPRVAALRDDESLAAVSRVWPFETGFTESLAPPRGPFVLHAEIWPSLVPADASLHGVRDAAQVATLARHLAALDERGELARQFGPPSGLGPRELAACVAEEGWILGA